MRYRDDARIDHSKVRYGGGGGGRRRGGLVIGGGAGGVVLLLLALFFGDSLGIDPLALLGGGEPEPETQEVQRNSQCVTGADIAENRDCRWDAYYVALDDYWASVVDGYESPEMVIFSGQVSTACGMGATEMGPFYCPGDTTIYVDSTFLGQLLEQLGAQGGDAAELYVVGHEWGHHISNLTGDMQRARARNDGSGPTSGQVRLELQADCYAGVFFDNTVRSSDSPIEAVTADDLKRIADAASAVGDDHIQTQQGGRVVPESWTHGSSAMRQHWVEQGFTSGNPRSCNTLDTDDLGG